MILLGIGEFDIKCEAILKPHKFKMQSPPLKREEIFLFIIYTQYLFCIDFYNCIFWFCLFNHVGVKPHDGKGWNKI